MDLGSVVKNPVVWGGGAVLGILLLMRSNPAEAAPNASANPTNTSAYMSAAVAMNSAVMGANVEIAKTNAALGAVAFQADTAKQLGYYHYLENADNNIALVTNQQVISNAGVTNSLIQSSTAIIVDESNNMTRLGEAYQETARAQIAADASIAVARYQEIAQKAASKNAMIGQIAGAIGGVAQTVAMGFAGVPPGMGGF